MSFTPPSEMPAGPPQVPGGEGTPSAPTETPTAVGDVAAQPFGPGGVGPAVDAAPADADADTGEAKGSMPGTGGYWFGALLMGLGSVGALVWFIISVAMIADASDKSDYVRVQVPGSRTVTFNETGTYDIYGEISTYVYSSTLINEPTVTIKDAAGSTIPVTETNNAQTYNNGSSHGKSFATVSIVSTGSYTIDVGNSRTTTSARAVQRVAVGRDNVPTGATIGVFASLLLGFVAFFGGGTLLIVTGVRRGRARRRLRPPPTYPGPGPYGGPPGPYGAPPGAYPGPYGAPPRPYGAPPGPYGAPPGPYGAPPGPYGAPPGPYGAPPGPYGAPPGPYGAPPGPYGAPPGAPPGSPGAPHPFGAPPPAGPAATPAGPWSPPPQPGAPAPAPPAGPWSPPPGADPNRSGPTPPPADGPDGPFAPPGTQ